MDVEKIKKYISELKEENPFISQVDLAYQVFLKSIIADAIPMGEKINQEYFAAELEMSRTPLREALMKLEKEGYVEKSDKLGYCVSKIKLKDYVDFCEFRIQIEAFAAFLAARNITAEQIKLLKNNLDKYIEACNRDDQRHMRKLDMEFHELIVEACNNPYVIEVYQGMVNKKKLFFRYSERAGRLSLAKKGHIEIYKAIVNQDEEKAKEAMIYHLKYYIRALYNIM